MNADSKTATDREGQEPAYNKVRVTIGIKNYSADADGPYFTLSVMRRVFREVTGGELACMNCGSPDLGEFRALAGDPEAMFILCLPCADANDAWGQP